MMEKIEQRIAGLERWLADESPYVVADQKHLDANTTERAYWHYGYLIALRDIRSLAQTGGKL